MEKDFADIITLINEHPLVTVTPATTRVLRTPEEIREEADRDRKVEDKFRYRFVDGENIKEPNPHFGKVIEKLHSTAFRKHLLDMADKGEPITLTTPQKVTINTANIGIIKAHIRKNWKIRDIIDAAPFIRGGIFLSSSEPSADSLLRKVADGEKVDIRWTRTSYGIVTESYEEDRELTRLWEALVRSCYITIGAASVLKIQDSRFLAGYAFADEGDGPTVYDFNLDALARKIPKEYAKQLDAAIAAREGAKEGSKEGVQKTLPKVYAKTATMSDEELRESTKPKPRKPGGGRKQTKDIGDKQVKAVLADMKKHKRESFRAHSGNIIRTMKDGDYTNPYSTAKDLDAAVRRYCKKHNITPSALTNRTGKWRSTK